MAKDKSASPGNSAPNPSAGNVVSLPTRCPVEGCGKKPSRMHFCSEHFEWFKMGLVNRQGERPKDFDKKYQAYLRKQEKAA